MAHIDALKNRYAAVLQQMESDGLVVKEVREEGVKLYCQAIAGSEAAKNKIWDAIKSGHPGWENDLICDIRVDPQAAPASAAPAAPATRTYTVKAGDTLSKIAKEFYGNANQYMKIFEANKDKLKNPDQIKVGQDLVIP